MMNETIFFKLNQSTNPISEILETESILNDEFSCDVRTGNIGVIENIFEEWKVLCAEGASNEPFFRPEWFLAFVKNFQIKIILFAVRRNGKLRAILPMMNVKEPLHGIPMHKLKSVFNLQTQRFDLIHGNDESERSEIIKVLWQEMKKQSNWNVLKMRLVKKDSWLNDLLVLAEDENYRTGIWKMDSAPFILLPQGENKEQLKAEFYKGLSKNRRQFLKKKKRQLEEIGEIKFSVTRGFSTELMEKYFALEAQSWKARGGTAVSSSPQAMNLHSDFSQAVALENALFIHELKLNGQTIAMYISIMFDRKMIGWKTSFSEEFAKYSPGNLLFIEVLNEAMRNDATELDHLSPETYNKSLWSSGSREHAAFYIFQKGIIGSLLWSWKFKAISYLRRYKKTK